MIVYEFYLRDAFKDRAFEALSGGFIALGEAFTRKVDGEVGTAVYSVSRNQATHWVQLLVDDNTPPAFYTAIEARINGLSDGAFTRYEGASDHLAPRERPREEIGI